MRDIPNKDIFLLCHTKEEKNGLVTEHELCFDGKMPIDIKKQFDLVVHMIKMNNDAGVEKRVFITSGTMSKISKARVSPFLDVQIDDIEEANLYKLALKLKGE